MRAAFVGAVTWPNTRTVEKRQFWLEAAADLAAEVLQDAGVSKDEVDGVFIPPVPEQKVIAPAGVVEYLGLEVNMGEIVDMGGASPAAAVWRAAMAIQAGVCNVALILFPAPRPPSRFPDGRVVFPLYGGGEVWGAPQAQYEFPSSIVAAIPSFAILSRRYMAQYGVSEEALAQVPVEQRYNANANAKALFRDKQLTIDDVMRSPQLSEPVKAPDVVAPCFGGTAVLMVSEKRAKSLRHRPVYLTGWGERINIKSMTYAKDLLVTPLSAAVGRALSMAGVTRDAFDFASIYDCFSVTVPVTLENAGFCKPGEGLRLFEGGAARFDSGGFPINPNGGQLGAGQPSYAGGMSHIVDSILQIQGRAGGHQVRKADCGFVNGTGGMMAEQIALVLEGA
jgi:acetyl-CoA C-acetyltransferase